jgi:hypothetical protein
MVSVTRYFLPLLAVAIACSCSTQPTTLAFSKRDHTTKWWGNPSYGPRQHYEHVVRDSRGQIKDVYRYYWDEHGKPVLDGDRLIYRWEHDPGLLIEYRDGREIRRSQAFFTG